MEKIINKTMAEVEKSEEFKAGAKEFKDKTIKNNGVGASWYGATVSEKMWNDFYSKTGGYTKLDENKQTHEVKVGFLSVLEPEGGLEITNMDDLIKIQRHREATNIAPLPFPKNT